MIKAMIKTGLEQQPFTSSMEHIIANKHSPVTVKYFIKCGI